MICQRRLQKAVVQKVSRFNSTLSTLWNGCPALFDDQMICFKLLTSQSCLQYNFIVLVGEIHLAAKYKTLQRKKTEADIIIIYTLDE